MAIFFIIAYLFIIISFLEGFFDSDLAHPKVLLIHALQALALFLDFFMHHCHFPTIVFFQAAPQAFLLFLVFFMQAPHQVVLKQPPFFICFLPHLSLCSFFPWCFFPWCFLPWDLLLEC